MFRVIARNVAANWIGYAVNAVVGLLLTPFVLGHLGESRFGLFSLVASIVGYYGLLDLGLRAGTTQLLTRQLANRQFDALNRTIGTVLTLLGPLGAFIAAVSIALGLVLPWAFHLPDELRREAFWCTALLGGSAALQCVFFPFASLFTATQRYDLSNAIGIATRLLSALATWWALESGYGLVGLVAATSAVNVLDYSARWAVAHRLVPQLRADLRGIDRDVTRSILSFSLWNFLITMNVILLYQTDAVLIGLFLPVAAIALYALASNMIRYLLDVLGSARAVFFPAAAHLHALDDMPAIRRLYLDGSRFLLLATLALIVIAGSWAGDFYRLWVGRKHLDSASLATVVLIFRILLVHIAAEFAAGTSGQILLGSGRVKVLGLLATGQAVVNLVVSLALAPALGLVGIALGTVASSVALRAVPTAVIAGRALGIPFHEYVRHVAPRPLALATVLAAICMAIRRVDPPHSFVHLSLHGLAAAITAAVLILVLGVDARTRSRLLTSARRIISPQAAMVPVHVGTDVDGEVEGH